MIRIDVSRALPTSALRQLVALIPGFFFLICMALGNTYLTAQLTAQLQFAFPYGQLATVFVVLFLSFVIGSASISLVHLIQYFMLRLYRPYFLVRGWLREQVFLPCLNRILKVTSPQPNSPPPKPKPRWLFNLRSQTIQRIYSPDVSARATFQWWEALAEQLLRTRYGMKETNFPNASRQPLIDVLITPTQQELRGTLAIIALHATGWTALAASRFAPDLRARWFYPFAYFLIGIGLLHDFAVADYRMNPTRAAAIRLRALLREFPNPKAQQIAQIQSDEVNEDEDGG